MTAFTIGLKMLYDNYKCDLEFICGNKAYEDEIIENCPSLKEGAYYPTLYLPTATFQLMYGFNQKLQTVTYELHAPKADDG